MLIYNVTIKLEHTIENDWVQWMQKEHMPALLATGCFHGYQLNKLLEQDESEGVTYVAQYYCHTKEDYLRYIDQFSNAMRQAGLDKFGNKFIAFRTLMKKISSENRP